MPIITIANPTPYRVAIPGVGSVNGGTSQQFVVDNAKYPDALKALVEAQALQRVTFTSALTSEERTIAAESSGAVGASGAVDASGIPYAGPDLEATNIKAAVDELAADTESLQATVIAYDNDDSGLAADDVQAAIDEVNAAIVNAIKELEDRVAALEGAPSNLGGALAASWSPSIDINSINGGSLTLDA